jgi:hypothetical protein
MNENKKEGFERFLMRKVDGSGFKNNELKMAVEI